MSKPSVVSKKNYPLYPQGVMKIVNKSGVTVGFSAIIDCRVYLLSVDAVKSVIPDLPFGLKVLPAVLEGYDRSVQSDGSSVGERFASYDLTTIFLNYKKQLFEYMQTGKVEGFSVEEMRIFRDSKTFLDLLDITPLHLAGDVLRTVEGVGYVLTGLELRLNKNRNSATEYCTICVYGSHAFTSDQWDMVSNIPFRVTKQSKDLGVRTSFVRLVVNMSVLERLVALNQQHMFLSADGLSVITTLDGDIIHHSQIGLNDDHEFSLVELKNQLHKHHLRQGVPFKEHHDKYMHSVTKIFKLLGKVADFRPLIYRDIDKVRLEKEHRIMIQEL